MNRGVDLRSDTVTRPSEGMRRAMAAAEVGDDVFGDDPTVKRLESRTAEMLGKEEALFFPSGTMSNQTAIAVFTHPGDEIICEVDAHCYVYEGGMPARFAGVSLCTIEGFHGALTAPMIRKRLRPDDIHQPRTALICLENTHNRAGGRVFPVETMKQVRALSRERGIPIHLDGARLFNAAVARRLPVTAWSSLADTVNICLSKGLGAPIGSLLAGETGAIREARRIRKRLGGGMRQVGIIAAAALYALDHNLLRLAEDHAHARRLAEGLASMPGLEVRPAETETNIVLIHLTDECRFTVPELLALLAEFEVRMVAFDERTIRAVTHLDVNSEDIDRAIEVFARLLAPAAGR